MSLIEPMLQEFNHESSSTRRILERVPEDRLEWSPHGKSMSLGRLAGHIAQLPHWGQMIFASREFDFQAPREWTPVIPETTAHLLTLFETEREGFLAVAKDRSDSEMEEHWRLRDGEHVILEMPRAAVLRSFVLSHIIHHRGQLSVFLRLLDVPVPGMYGPSADDEA